MTGGRTRRPVRPDIVPKGVITSLGFPSGDPDARYVTIGRRRIATLYQTDIDQLDIRPGCELDPQLAEALADGHEFRIGYRSALRRLAAKARSSIEIQRGLRLRGHQEKVIDRILSQLTQAGFLDDAQYAQTTAEALARQRPASARFIEAKLRQRGIDADTAGRVAAEAAGDPREAARAVAQRALRSLTSYDEPTRHRRLWGRLARRGFSPDVISDVLRELVDFPDD